MMGKNLRQSEECVFCSHLSHLQHESLDMYLCMNDPEYEIDKKVIFSTKEEFEAKEKPRACARNRPPGAETAAEGMESRS